MSSQIEQHLVDQFSANVYHLAQQKESRLRPCVRTESQNGKNAFFDQIGKTEMVEKVSRHMDTPQSDTPHARRRVTLRDFVWSDLIDQEDKLKMIYDPTSPYAQAAAAAAGRTMDREIIEAATTIAYTGERGATQTAFDTNMIVDVQVGSGDTPADVGLNVGKLRAAAKLLRANEHNNDEKFLVLNAQQLDQLLGQTQVTSADFNSVKALVDGNVDTFMGFKFIHTELIQQDANGDDMVLFFAKSALLLSVGKDKESYIEKRADKNYATQVFCSMSVGATRMEETGVGYIECHPS